MFGIVSPGFFLVTKRPINMTVYFRDEPEKATVHDITLWQKLQIKLAMSPIYCILTPGPPVPALTLQRQASGRVATRVPVSKPLEWLDQERRGAIPGSPSLETDALLLHQ